MSTEELLLAWRDEGREAAFEALFERYHVSIYRVLYRMVGDEAEDLMQETFLRLYQRPPWQEDTGGGAWLEEIGSATGNQTMVDLGIMSCLVVPSEAMWKTAAHLMQHPTITSQGISPFSVGAPPSTAMLDYALLYVGAMLGLTIWSFNRCDL